MNFIQLITKLFGNKSQKDMRAIAPYVEQIKAAYADIDRLTNDQLRERSAMLMKTIADLQAEKKNRIAMYVTSGIGLLGTAATIISRWMMFSTGLKFEQDGVYTSPMTKSIAQDAVRDKNTKF